MSDNDWVRPDPRHAVELLRDILFETADPGDERLVTLVPLSPRPASPRAPMRRGKSGRLRGSTAQGSDYGIRATRAEYGSGCSFGGTSDVRRTDQNQSEVRCRPVSYVHWNPNGLHDHPYSTERHEGSFGRSALHAASIRSHPTRWLGEWNGHDKGRKDQADGQIDRRSE